MAESQVGTGISGLGAMFRSAAPGAVSSSSIGELRGVARVSAPGTEYQSAITAGNYPADPRNDSTADMNDSEHITVNIARFSNHWERALQYGNLAFSFMTGPGQDNRSRNIVTCTLPVANFTLQLGQLTANARLTRNKANPALFQRQIHGFTDGTLYDKDDDKDKTYNIDGEQAGDHAAILDTMMIPFGVVQDTTGIGAKNNGSMTSQPRSSLIPEGKSQVHHIWGTTKMGDEVFLAVARMARGVTGNGDVTLLSGPNDTVIPRQSGSSDSMFAKEDADLHPHPYVIVPCWSHDQKASKAIGNRFQFHPLHNTAIQASRALYPTDSGITYIKVGDILHPPTRRANVTSQELACFDDGEMAKLPLVTLSLAPEWM